jgi:hypothetical protein
MGLTQMIYDENMKYKRRQNSQNKLIIKRKLKIKSLRNSSFLRGINQNLISLAYLVGIKQ